MACDLAMVSDLAIFGQAGPRHGSAPDGGSTDFLPWFLSMEDAMFNCISCEMWSAYKMKLKGLITKVTPVLRQGDEYVRNPSVITDRYVGDGEVVYGEMKTGAEAKAARAQIKEGPVDFELLDGAVEEMVWRFTNLFPGCLQKSIDGIRAILMHDSTTQARQVVLVTSPASMEGCTTVASHLALSLTRAGRRTLLVDGDLREPSLHKLFGMPVEDGMCEVLRSEIDVAEVIRPTNTEGLWLMTAGQCDTDAVHALATDQLQPIFEKLRAEFDFVIIDGAPLLGLSDSISIGQHVDGAILTLLRDHSEIRKVLQSAELLKNMGIQLFGAVVNGVHQKADRRVARLHRTAAKPPRKLTAGAES